MAADSRQTIIDSSGGTRHDDGVRKWMPYGKNTVSAVAGDAHLAAFITQKVVDEVGETPEYPFVKTIFDTKLADYARQYNQVSGRFCSCSIMVAGIDNDSIDDFDAGRLGAVMAGEPRTMPDGTTFTQSMDSEVIRSMHYAFSLGEILGRPPGRGTIVPVQRPRTELIGYTVNVALDGVHIATETAGNYQALFYGADAAFNKIELPDELMTKLYFRERNTDDINTILQQDTMYVFAFIKSIIEERGYTNVGGGIFPVMLYPENTVYYAGEISQYNLTTRRTVIARDSKVTGGHLCYKNEKGQYIPYKSLLDIASSIGRAFEVKL